MTAIIGIRVGGSVLLGGDRSASDHSSMSVLTSPKVFSVGEYVVGYSGGFTPGQVIAEDWNPPTPPRSFPALRRVVVESMRQCLDAHKVKMTGSEFLIGCRGKLYHLQDDWSLLPQRARVVGLGSGGTWAEAAAEALLPFLKRLKLRPETLIRRALAIAASHSTSVTKPFDVVRCNG